MSPSFEFSTSSLLCQEEEEMNFILLSDEEFVDSGSRNLDRRVDGGDEIRGLVVQSDECILEMVKKEIEHLGKSDYLARLKNGDFDLVSRNEVIHWITKVIAHYNFGPLCAYLAVSYLDRFLSAYKSPEHQTWTMQLMAVACLSLAAKVEEVQVPLTLDLQVANAKCLFKAQTVQKMELLIFSTLKWRIQAITPFSFIDHFLYKINGETPPPKSAIALAIQLILNVITGIEYLEYRPSEIAAAVAVSVGLETQTVEVDNAIHLLVEYVKKDRVLKCMEMFQEPPLSKGPDEGLNGDITPSVPHSPNGVLDNTCMSYKSDETLLESSVNSSHISIGSKRRKLE